MSRKSTYIVCAIMLALTACGNTLTPATQSAPPVTNTIATTLPTQPPATDTSAPPTPSIVADATSVPSVTPEPVKGAQNAKEVDAMVRSQLTAANTRFGIKLFNQILKQDSEKNVFISPASVAIALAMTYNGASGDTQKAMAQTLELNGMSLQDVNTAYAALRSILQNADPKVKLAIANSLWVRQGVTLAPDFLQRNQSYYHAQVQELDFADPGAPAAINAWVSQNTNGKIPKIVNQISPDMVLYLINAIYFKGTWSKQFDIAKTSDLPFFLLDGSQKQVPMMAQSGTFTSYLKGDHFQAVGLPYGDGRMSMFVFLPDQDSSLSAFEQSLTDANWNQWMSQLHKAEGNLKLPRFQLEYEVNLNDTLKALGMSTAFDPEAADFSAMHTGPDRFFISEVKHKTFVEVNEEGTEAAAATSVGIGTTAMRPQEDRFNMIVDRPFFIAIRDNTTGEILFMGSIVQP